MLVREPKVPRVVAEMALMGHVRLPLRPLAFRLRGRDKAGHDLARHRGGAHVRDDVDLRLHDAVALEEIELYAEVLSAVAAADGQLTTEEIDEVLGLHERAGADSRGSLPITELRSADPPLRRRRTSHPFRRGQTRATHRA